MSSSFSRFFQKVKAAVGILGTLRSSALWRLVGLVVHWQCPIKKIFVDRGRIGLLEYVLSEGVPRRRSGVLRRAPASLEAA